MLLSLFKEAKKPQIFLHVGMNKTGTSALQSYFLSNKKSLLSKGILYPSAGLIGSAHYSLSASLGFANSSVNASWVKDKKMLSKAFRSEIRGQVNTVIFSSEDFLLNKPIAEVKQFFKGYDVKIVVYLRRHDHWWLSAYTQAVKMKRSPPWNMGPVGFINFNRRRNKQYSKYRHLVDRWATVFGKENIIVRPYEKAQNQPHLASDFLTAVGRDDVLIDLPSMENKDNQRLPWKAIQLLDVFQRLECDDTKHKILMDYALQQVDEEPVKGRELNPAFRLQLIKENEEDYQYIAKEYLGREDGRLFYEALPEVDENWQNLKWPGHAEVAQHVLHALS